jgi:hypothetical protein
LEDSVTTTGINDFLYFDFEKAASIFSQLEGGLRERLSVTEDKSKDTSAGASFGIPKIAEAKLGAEYVEKRSVIESKLLHHDLFFRVESQLKDRGLVSDLTADEHDNLDSPEKIREVIGGSPYIKASGWGVIEDYRRISFISENFNKLISFISECGTGAIKQSPEYAVFQEQIDELRISANSMQNRGQKAVAKQQIKALEKTLEDMLKPQVTPVDQYLIDGIKLWINTFMPNRINFRIYPFEAVPSFQVICNLKRECFVDQDLEHLLYGYGNRPNIKLAVFGLITSIPPKEDVIFDPLNEFVDSQDKTEEIVFEEAFRRLFGAMDNIEAFTRYSRYPNVTVHPIAVFRML